MSNDNVIPLYASASSEVRAQIISLVLRHVASVPSQVRFSALVRHVLGVTNYPEEEAAPEIMDATVVLIRAGIFTCNRSDPFTSEIIYGADTCVGLGPAMMGYIWAEDTFAR